MNHPVVPKAEVSSIQSRFEKYLYGELKAKNESDRRFPLSPSSVLNCKRKLSYELINYNDPSAIPFDNFSLRQLLVFENGHLTEERVMRILGKIPNLDVIIDKGRKKIFPLDKNTDVTGEIDAYFRDKDPNGKRYIADCKAVSSFAFSMVADKITQYGRENYHYRIPKEDNYFQLQLYLSSQWAQDQGITHGLLYYERKDTQEWLLLEFPYNKGHANWARERLTDIYLSNGELSRDYVTGKDWNCNRMYCSFYEYCHRLWRTTSESSLDILDEDVGIESDKGDVVISALLKYGDAKTYHYTPTNEVFKLELVPQKYGSQKEKFVLSCPTRKFGKASKKSGVKSSA